MKNVKIVAYYCGANKAVHDKYTAGAEKLKKQLDEYGYDYEIKDMSHYLKDWMPLKPHKAITDRYWLCRLQPLVALIPFRNTDKDILYMHCDSEILKPLPEKWEGDVVLSMKHKLGKLTVEGCPVFIKNNPGGKAFLETWHRCCLGMQLNVESHRIMEWIFPWFKGVADVRLMYDLSSREEDSNAYIYF